MLCLVPKWRIRFEAGSPEHEKGNTELAATQRPFSLSRALICQVKTGSSQPLRLLNAKSRDRGQSFYSTLDFHYRLSVNGEHTRLLNICYHWLTSAYF